MIEIRGRQVRVSDFKEKGNIVRLKSGSQIKMCGGKWPLNSDAAELRISSDQVCRYLKANDLVHFDNGKVVAIVRAVNEREANLEIKLGGTIKGNCCVRFVGGKHAQLDLTQRVDLKDL
jgi:pyruvate kinase